MGQRCFNTVDTFNKRIFKVPELCSSTAPSGILANFSRHFFLSRQVPQMLLGGSNLCLMRETVRGQSKKQLSADRKLNKTRICVFIHQGIYDSADGEIRGQRKSHPDCCQNDAKNILFLCLPVCPHTHAMGEE